MYRLIVLIVEITPVYITCICKYKFSISTACNYRRQKRFTNTSQPLLMACLHGTSFKPLNSPHTSCFWRLWCHSSLTIYGVIMRA